MPQNVGLDCDFGPYPAGKVVPQYVFVGHDLDAYVARGLVHLTDKPVNVEVVPPKVATPALPEDVVAERNRLADENRQLAADNKVLAGRVAELDAHREALKAELGKYVEENGHLKAACEDHQSARDKLEAELAAAHQLLADAAKPAGK